LLDGGCDLIFLETFAALDELLLALEVFQNLSNIPVATSLAVSEEGRLVSGETFPEAVNILRAAGADIVGLNGTCGPQACVHLLSKLAVEENELLCVYPSAGKPEFYEGRFNYAANPGYFADTLPRWWRRRAAHRRRLRDAPGTYRGHGGCGAGTEAGAREENFACGRARARRGRRIRGRGGGGNGNGPRGGNLDS